jgi:peptidyl-prolyl cis-trans isomerase SurA
MTWRNRLLAGLVVALTMAGGAQPAWAVRKLVGRVIARINNSIITNWQYQREEEKLRAELGQKYSGDELNTQYQEQSKNLLRDLIDQELMVQKAKDLDISVETDLVKRLDEIRRSMHLATEADLEKEVEKEGMLWEDFQDNIRRNLLMQQVIGQAVGSRIIISREDARKYYDAHREQFNFPPGVHLAELLVSTASRSPDEAQKRAQEALDKLKNGARWNDIVDQYSDDPSSSSGGDIGFFKKGALAVGLEAAVSKVEAGDTTGIIPTQYGDMILKVLQRTQGGIAPFDDVEQRIDELLYNQKMQPALRDYLTTLREQSYIRIAPGFEDSGATTPALAQSER